MAVFFDDFDGTAGQWVKDRPGWAHSSGYYDALQIDGSGNLAIAARSNDGRSVIHGVGDSSMYVEVVVGAGFLLGQGELVIGIAASTTSDGLNLAYYQAESELILRFITSTLYTYTGPLSAGDTLKLCYLYSGNAYELYRNGVLLYSNDVSGFAPPPRTGTILAPSYSSSAARSDVLRSFKADVYSGPPDLTAPTITSATGAATGDTTATGSVTTNEGNGTLYYVTTGNATETAATVRAGSSQTVTAVGVQGITATGLPSGTTLRHHFLHRDAAGNDSAVLSSGTFTTTAPDVTPPQLTSPIASATGSTTATGSVNTDEANGTLYFLATTNATETAATIKAGASQAVSVTGVQGVSVTGLTAATAYYLHFLHRDAEGNDSVRATSAQFTTGAAPGTPKLTLPPLRNNTGTLLASQAGATAHVYEVATGNKVATVTGCASDAAGVMQVPHASMVIGTEYRAVIVLANGAEGLQKATATS